MRVYQCEDNLEGVCTAIYRAYEEHAEHRDTWIRVDRELMLLENIYRWKRIWKGPRR